MNSQGGNQHSSDENSNTERNTYGNEDNNTVSDKNVNEQHKNKIDQL